MRRYDDDYSRGFESGFEKGKSAGKGGIGFLGLLTIVFIVLKLLNIIDWAWIWVLAPLWGAPVLIFLGFIIILLLCYFLQ